MLLTSVKVGNAFIDLRTVAVLISGFLGGPVSAIVTIGLSLFFRFQLGGPFMLPAFAMAAAALLGIGANALGVRCTLRTLIAFGAGLALLRTSMPVLSYLLGARDLATALDASASLFPVAIFFFPIGMVAMGGLLKFEGKRADQTAGLKSENAILSERDARFQALFDRSSVAMLWTTKDSRIVRANQRMADLVGYSVEELEGKAYEELIFPEDREEFFRIRDTEVERGVATKDIERRFLKKGGGFFWGLRSITKIESAPDAPFQKITMIQDITEQKQAEGRIRFQAQLLASVEQAVIATDMSGSIIFWNRFAENLFGWPSVTVLGSHIEAIVPAIRDSVRARRPLAEHRFRQELVRRVFRAPPRRLDHSRRSLQFAGA